MTDKEFTEQKNNKKLSRGEAIKVIGVTTAAALLAGAGLSPSTLSAEAHLKRKVADILPPDIIDGVETHGDQSPLTQTDYDELRSESLRVSLVNSLYP